MRLQWCPYCRNKTSKVVSTRETTDDRIVRRRNCLVCDARWYTIQSKEEYLEDKLVQYVKGTNLPEKIKVLDEKDS